MQKGTKFGCRALHSPSRTSPVFSRATADPSHMQIPRSEMADPDHHPTGNSSLVPVALPSWRIWYLPVPLIKPPI